MKQTARSRRMKKFSVAALTAFNIALFVQILGCIALLSHFHATEAVSETNGLDPFYLYYIQLFAAVMQVIPDNIIPIKKSKMLMVFLVLSIGIGLLTSVLFLLSYNQVELDCIYNGVCLAGTFSILRGGLFLATEVAIVHPTVSLILHLWNPLPELDHQIETF